MGNLPDNVRHKDVEDVFGKYGPVKDIDIKMPKVGQRGGTAFAFLEFEDSRDADDAIRYRDGYDFDGYKLRVEAAQGRRAGDAGFRAGGFGGRDGGFRGGFRGRGRGGPPVRSKYRVLISGLPPTGSWQDVKDHMREAGDVTYSDVFRDGTGVVEYLRRDDMEWALKNLDDSKFKSHENETSHIRCKRDSSRSRSRSRSYSRSKSRSRSRSPHQRRRGSPSPSRSRSRSRSHSRSRSPSPS